ncbi:hypothetical protein CRENBAI_025845 [Crenichthys baileyi]|uniref:Uncharacterized protein n=1 Tax=Crenichthys baileyi TaxID=28760 RepID=A0AAV9QQA8_9TELE
MEGSLLTSQRKAEQLFESVPHLFSGAKEAAPQSDSDPNHMYSKRPYSFPYEDKENDSMVPGLVATVDQDDVVTTDFIIVTLNKGDASFERLVISKNVKMIKEIVGAEQAGDLGADHLTAGSGTRRTHGGAKRRGAETAGTFGKAMEIETKQAERVRLRTPQRQEQEVETGSPRTPPEREPGMEAVHPRSPPVQDREQEQGVEAVHPQAPHGQEQSVRAVRLVAPLEENQEQDRAVEAVHP